MRLLNVVVVLLTLSARRVGWVIRPPLRWRPAQGLVEYALLLMLVAIVVVGAVTMTGRRVSTTYSAVECGLAGTHGGQCTAVVNPPAAPTPCVEAGNSGNCPGGLNP